MRLFRWFIRKKQSKGHGVHSPFAFNLITNVIYSPYSYYAFKDIAVKKDDVYEKNNSKCRNNISKIKSFNHLSFRLVNHFKPKTILEIYPGDGLNSLFIKSYASSISYCGIDMSDIHSLEGQSEVEIQAEVHDVPKMSDMSKKYDAIFINIERHTYCLPDIECLLKHSSKQTFWVINNINFKKSKQLWRSIVNDENISMTFDVKNETGIAFLSDSFHKLHYFV